MRFQCQVIVCIVIIFVDVCVVVASHGNSSDLPVSQLGQSGQSRGSLDNLDQAKVTTSPQTHAKVTTSPQTHAKVTTSPQTHAILGAIHNERPGTYPQIGSLAILDSLVQTNLSYVPGKNNMAKTTSASQRILKVIQDEATHFNLTSGGVMNSNEVFESLLKVSWGRVLKLQMAQEHMDDLFPRPANLSLHCYQHLMDFIDGLAGVADEDGNIVTPQWALEMFDSYGKPSAGLLQGVLQWVGNYEECLNTHARVVPSRKVGHDVKNNTVKFGGKYCRVVIDVDHIVKVSFPENTNRFWLRHKTFPVLLNWGVCVPDTCGSTDIRSFLTEGTLSALNLTILKVVCFDATRFGEDAGAVAFVVVLFIFLVMITLCTLLDIYCYRPWLSYGDQKNTIARQNTKGSDDTLQIERGICVTDLRHRSDVSAPGSIHRGSGEHVSREKNGADTHSVLKNDDGATNNTSPAAVEETDRKGWIWLLPLKAKARRHQSQAGPNAATAGVISAGDSWHLESGLPNTAGIDRRDKTRRKTIGENVIQVMSLYRNMRSLLGKTKSQGTFPCIQGIRVISLAWIVIGHCYTYGGMLDENNLIFENPVQLVETSSRLSFHVVGSAHLAVDTFIVISACLSMRATLKMLSENKTGIKFWFTFFFHRFWRLTPQYMVVLVAGMTLYDHVVQGPLKSDNMEEFAECRHKWWSHLLYINNLYRPDMKCMTWSWYMAVDMQLHLIAPIFIYTVHRNLKAGIGLILCLLVLGVSSAFVSEYIHGGQFVLMDLSFLEYWSYVYTMPWARASVFATGLILGVILYKHVGSPVISKRTAFIVWLIVTFVSLFLILINHNQWKHDSQNWSRVQQSFYESLVRPAWAICIAWVIFACCTNLGGFANVILCWRPFLVLSRLTYSLYLIHPMVIMFVVYSRRTTVYLDPANLSLVYNYIGNLTFTFLLSAVFSLIFEMPMKAMENIFWLSH